MLMKKMVKHVLKTFGYELKKITFSPVGQMDILLEELKIRGLNCKQILDVGANRADWSRMAKEIFPEASFYLIEPQIEMEKYLKAFVNEFSNSVYFLNGVGARKESLIFTIRDNLAGSSFFPDDNEKLLKNRRQRKIEVIKIDDLIDSNKMKIPELIKLDIQGYELEALKGAIKTFGHTEVYILEVSLFSFGLGMPIISDVMNFMLNHGYVIYDFPGFLKRPLDGALAQCDICFVKKDGFLRESNNWE